MTDLDRLDVLAAAATPGPWAAEKYEPYDEEWNEDTYGWWVNGPEWAEGSGEFRNFTGPNAAFIAACDPATIRELVAAVRERDELRAFIERQADVIHDHHSDRESWRTCKFWMCSEARAALNRENET